MTERIEADPVIPLEWPGEQKGMQGGDEIPEALRPLAEAVWLHAKSEAIRWAKMLHNIEETAQKSLRGECIPMPLTNAQWWAIESFLDKRLNLEGATDHIRIHKSLPNRIVEPWMWITVVMTATEWKNFFRLRCHPDAEIHFQKIAGMIRDSLNQSVPQQLKAGDWHLPFVTHYDQPKLVSEDGLSIGGLKRVSAARCARISYLTHEGKREPVADLDLFSRLEKGSGFGHWSPPEHVGEATDDATLRSGPFIGWKQFRKEFPLENSEG